MNELFTERLQRILGSAYTDATEAMINDTFPTFRVNTLVVPVEEGVQRLRELGYVFDHVEFVGNGFVLKNKTKREFTDLEEYRQGWFYLQSLSSMMPIYFLSDEKLNSSTHALDMCAAPGSKTSLLSALLHNSGLIDAYDVSRQRIFQMKSVLSQLHVTNVFIHQADASNIWRKYGPVFDVVLLDAVCSGEGRFNLSKPETYEDWSIKKIKKMAELQRTLIFSAIMCLKPGGTLVYSTCTFAPEENEAIVDFALKKFEGAIEVEELTKNQRPANFLQGINSWEDTSFDPRVSRCIRIAPTEIWDGFFICKLHRN